MKKGIIVISSCILVVVLCTVTGMAGFVIGQVTPTVIGAAQATPGKDEPSTDFNIDKLEEVRQYIEDHYLNDVDNETLLNGAIKGMLASTGDKYFAYFTPEEYQEYEQAGTGEYVGIGVLVNENQTTGEIKIIQVYDDSPAKQAGIRAGDILLSINGKTVDTFESLEDLAAQVKGEAGTSVELTVRRAGEDITVTCTRASVISSNVDYRMLSDDVGYMKIYQFDGDAADKFHQGMQEMLDAGAKGFVLDLRDNPGGKRSIVVDIADYLFPESDILILKNKQGEVTTDTSDADCLGLPLVVLVNGNSASASELLSGGIQDLGVGIIVGETTYGKGVAQSFETMSDGSVVKMTTEDYLTAGGRSVQDVGVVPDYPVAQSQTVEDDSTLRITDADTQYTKAMELLRQWMDTGEKP